MKNNLRRYDVIRKIASAESNNCTTGCLLDYPYFKKYYKLIAIDLSKQQKTDANPKAMQQINLTGNPSSPGGANMFFINEEAKEPVLNFSKRIVKVLWFYFVLK